MARFVRSRGGMIGAGHALAAADGLEILRDGGNAIDAAVAAAATLAIVAPHECGLGGDLFALIYDASSRETVVLNASGRSPAAASLEEFSAGIPPFGPLTISVPGMVGGWAAAVGRFASRPWPLLLEPAIRRATDGFVVSPGFAGNTRERAASIGANRAASALFMPHGRPVAAGDVLRQPQAADTLRTIAREGAEAFYRGDVARSLAKDLAEAGSPVTAADLADYAPIWQPPLTADAFGCQVLTTPPNTWGAALLLQLKIIEAQGLASDEAQFILRGIRARRHAYRALAGCIADPELVGDKARDLIVSFDRADAVPRAATETMAGTDTSQVVCIDSAGHAVVLLQSVFVPFGSGILLPETGVVMNNRLCGFNTKADDVNCIAPRKRPAQTLTPAMTMQDGRPLLVCASPGGPGQTGTLAQFVTRVIGGGEPLDSAIAKPRWAITLKGEWILEDRAPQTVRDEVIESEPAVQVAKWGSVNHGSIVALMRQGPEWVGCADERRDAEVLGI